MAKRSSMTETLAAEIKRFARETSLYQHEIAATLGINQGRVSEVLNGKRYWWVQ